MQAFARYVWKLFIRFSTNSRSFLLESASYLELEDVILVLHSAFGGLDIENQDQTLLAGIYSSSGLMWAHRGFFDRAEPLLKESKAIKTRLVVLDRVELSWSEVSIGNVTASVGGYQESLNWQIQALRNRQIAAGDDYEATKFHGVLLQNVGRSKYLLGLYLEALV